MTRSPATGLLPSTSKVSRGLMDGCGFRSSPIHGVGVFATKDIEIGTMLIQERAMWVVDKMTAIKGTFSKSLDHTEARSRMIESWAIMGRTGERTEHLNFDFFDLLQLFDGTNENGEMTRKKAVGEAEIRQQTSEQLREILILNGVSAKNEGHAANLAVFHGSSRINHSCVPNAERTSCAIIDGSVWAMVIATAPIKKGEEIFIRYTDPLASSRDRQYELQARWNFTCKCPLCSRSKKEIAASDDRRDRLEAACIRIKSWAKEHSKPKHPRERLESYQGILAEHDKNILGVHGWEEIEKLASKEHVNDLKLWDTLMTISDAAGRAKKLRLESKLVKRLIAANDIFQIGRQHKAYLEDRRRKLQVAMEVLTLQIRAASDLHLGK